MQGNALLAVVLAASVLAAQDAAAGERRLATIPGGILFASTQGGPDGKRYTYRSRFAFGAGGRFVAYDAFRGGKAVAMVGDTEIGAFDYLENPVMDERGLHYAFRAGVRVADEREQWWPVVDGKKGKAYDWIGGVAVDGDGLAAFWSEPGARIQKDGIYTQRPAEFCVGSRAGKKFEVQSPLPPVFSVGDPIAVTVAMQGGKAFLVTGTKRGEKVIATEYSWLQDAVPSPDGKRMALVAADGGPLSPPGDVPLPGGEGGKSVVVVDGKKYGDDTDGAGSPVFAPTGRRFAYKFVRGGKVGVAFDNDKRPAAAHEFVGTVVFDGKGAAVAYATNTGGQVDDGMRLLRVAEAEGGTWSLWTRDVGKDEKAVVAGAEGIRFPAFGPSGELAYALQEKGRWHIVVGDRRSAACDDVGEPQWSVDGSKIEFGARLDRELWWKVLDVK